MQIEFEDSNIISLMDELSYRCYRFNRKQGSRPEQFKLAGIANVDAMEKRFQLERIQEAHREFEGLTV